MIASLCFTFYSLFLILFPCAIIAKDIKILITAILLMVLSIIIYKMSGSPLWYGFRLMNIKNGIKFNIKNVLLGTIIYGLSLWILLTVRPKWPYILVLPLVGLLIYSIKNKKK